MLVIFSIFVEVDHNGAMNHCRSELTGVAISNNRIQTIQRSVWRPKHSELEPHCWVAKGNGNPAQSVVRIIQNLVFWFFVHRVRQQQNGSAEKQCVEEKV
jgi:hypothetical protein